MGRHRRSAAGRAATGRATGATHHDGSGAPGRDPLDSTAGDRPAMGIAPYLNPEAYAEVRARSDAYLFGTDDSAGGSHDGSPADGTPVGRAAAGPGEGFAPDQGPQRGGARRRRRKKAAAPVRTGLLGVSAAVALGTVAVTTGVVPGLDDYRLGGGGGDRVQSADVPTNTPTGLGGTSGSVDGGSPTGTDHSASPSAPSSSAGSSAPGKAGKQPDRTGEAKEPGKDRTSGAEKGEKSRRTAKPAQPGKSSSRTPSSSSAPAGTPSASEKPAGRPGDGAETKPSPSRTATQQPVRPSAPVTVSRETAAEAEVLRLVNEERIKAGCSPVAANSALADLAGDFSAAMARQGFFDHTDPSGATPWDRAEKAGITTLGGENIARGQADAQAVMDAWMNSAGHRANILNCDFRTLGVGVNFGAGGPWWTQNFGY